MESILIMAAGVGLIIASLACKLFIAWHGRPRPGYPDCPDCRNPEDGWVLELKSIDNVRPRGFGRLPTPEARRYALEMIGDRYAQGEPFYIGDVPVTIAKVRNCPPTFAGTPTRSLRVVYPDGAEEYFEFETTGQIIYRGEIRD